MAMGSPNIIFKYAYPLDRGRRALFRERNLGKYPSISTVKNRADYIRQAWSKTDADSAVVNQLTQLTGVQITRDLEMYIFGSGLNAMSKPLMMPITNSKGRQFTEDEIVEIIIHELCHRFAGDQEETPRLDKYWSMIRKRI
jgi:hypothetical protein